MNEVTDGSINIRNVLDISCLGIVSSNLAVEQAVAE